MMLGSLNIFAFLFVIVIIDAKFLLEFPADDSIISKFPTCSLSGVRTVHLPENRALNFRFFFKTDEAKIGSIEIFDKFDQKVARLELSFTLSHIQLNWNGFITPWYQANQENLNFLEVQIKTKDDNIGFKLNGKIIPNHALISEQTPKQSYKLIYDESVVPDEDFSQLLLDTELNSFLLIDSEIKWQAPIIEIQEISHESQSKSTIKSSIDYIVYDSQIIKNVQIASGKSLPKLKFTKSLTKTKRNLFSIISRVLKLNQQQQDHLHLPIAFNLRNQKKDSQFVPYLIFSGFIIYLGILFYLSKMSSKSRVNTPEIQIQKSQIETSVPVLPSSISKSNSRTLAFTLPSSAPILVSTDSDSVLKVSVPAAFNLADNRHILFPSKLRNFQK